MLDQPASRLARRALAPVHHGKGHAEPVPLLGMQALERAAAQMRLHQMQRHVAPAEAAQQEFQPGVHVGEAPDVVADHADRPAGLLRNIGQDELHVLRQHVARQGPLHRGQGMGAAHHRHHGHVGQELALQIRDPGNDGGIDGQMRPPVPEIAFRRADPFRQQPDLELRELQPQRAQRRHDGVQRQELVHRHGQLRLQPRGDAGCPFPQCRRAVEQPPRIGDHHPPRLGRVGLLPGPVEEGQAQRAFQRLDGLADRRLHALQPARGGREAARIRHRHQHAELVQGQGIEHGPTPARRARGALRPAAGRPGRPRPATRRAVRRPPPPAPPPPCVRRRGRSSPW